MANRGSGDEPQHMDGGGIRTGAIPPALPPLPPVPNPPHIVPLPDLHVRFSDNAVVDGSDAILSVTPIRGPTLYAVPGHPVYMLGTKSRGIPSALFSTQGGRLESLVPLKEGLHHSFSLIVSWRPDATSAPSDYQVWRALGIQWIFAHITSLPAYNRFGHLTLSDLQWHSPAPPPSPLVEHHSLGVTFDGLSGISKFYQNGVLVASTVHTPLAVHQPMGIVTLGSSEQSTAPPINHWFTGSVDEHKEWVDFILNDGDMAEQHAALTVFHEIDPAPWDPTLVAGLMQYMRQDKKYGPGATVFQNALGLWEDTSGQGHFCANGTPGTEMQDGGVTGRPNGRPYLTANGVNQFMATQSVGSFTDGSAYDFWHIFRVDGVATTGGPAYILDQLFGDVSGFIWSGIDSTGVLKVGHWDGLERTVSVPFTVGEWFLMHWWYDGTTIRVQLNEGTVYSIAAGHVSTLVTPVAFARSSASTYSQISFAEDQLWNNVISPSNTTAHRNHMMERFDL